MSVIHNIEINGKFIGPGEPVYIVAEMSANHNQNFGEAEKIIRAAKEAGADAIKLQTYTPDTITIRSDREYFRIGGGTLWDGQTLYDLYTKTYMPWEWQPKLKSIADNIGINLFSSAFDSTAVDFLEALGVSAHKIASFEIVDIPLIEKMARTGKPLIMSTGMSSLGEIDEAVSAARKAGAKQIALLKCTSTYPAIPDDINLRTIPHLTEAFGLPVGLSDHTLGTAVPIAAAMLGACIIEKHFTLSRSISGPDSNFSLEPNEFKMMVDSIRIAGKATGEIFYGVSQDEMKSRVFRRSLFVVKDVKKGELFTSENVNSIRPGYGLPPKFIKEIIGKRAAQHISRGTPLDWNLVSA